MQKTNGNHDGIYRLLARLVAPFARGIFRFHHEKHRFRGPTLVICNHVTNYDPILVGISFPKDPLHFVCSEHLFRLGWISKVLQFVFDPIPRRKAVSGADTAMACLRKLRKGRNVCLFAEGECSWDGRTAPIVASTGRLVKMSNATLLTCRLEGGYLTAPRWGKGLRPGKMALRVVGEYAPEQLKTMDGDTIEAMIQRDIQFDTWQAQAQGPVAYRSRRRAENLQTVLYLCPKCRKSGSLVGKGKHLSCQCGQSWEFTPFGQFAPAEPFENIAQWDAWQQKELACQMAAGSLVLEDSAVAVMRLADDHSQKLLTTGNLSLRDGVLRCGDLQWPLETIDDMALVMSRNLLMSVGSDYYQLKAPKGSSMRKYRAAWEMARAKTHCEV